MILLTALSVFCLQFVTAQKQGFVLIAPSQLGSREKICVSFANPLLDKLSVSLLAHKVDEIIATAETNISGSYGCLTLEIKNPVLEPLARLVATISSGDRSYVTKTSRTVRLSLDPSLTFLTTDKPVYGADEEVRIRAFLVDRHLKPISEEVEKLWVENTQGVVVLEKTGIVPKVGLIEENFRLVSDPVAGTWKIKLQTFGRAPIVRTFLVQKHVVPFFNVSIVAPKTMETNQPAEVEICAEYIFGKPVHGAVRIAMSVVCDFEYYCRNDADPVVLNLNLDSRGCAREKLTAERINGPYLQYVVLNVSVTETGTGVAGEKSKKIVLLPAGAKTIIKGGFRLLTNRIKPGLPFHGELVLTPEKREWKSVDVTLCRSFDDEKICTVFETSDGVVPFTIPAGKLAEKIRVEAFWTNIDGKNSSSLVFLRPWISPSSNYAKILLPNKENLSCFSAVKITVLHTFHVDHDFIVALKTRGDISVFQNAAAFPDFQKGEHRAEKMHGVVFGPENTSPINFFSFYLNTNAEFSPEASIVVFTTDSNEVIADSTVLRFENCFPFRVETSWNGEEYLPGSRASLTVTAPLDSLCAVGVVDSRVRLLQDDNLSLRSGLFKQLAKFSHKFSGEFSRDRCVENKPLTDSTAENFLLHEPSSVFTDSLEAFDKSGFVVMSDLTVLSRPCADSAGIEPRNGESAAMKSLWDFENNEVALEESLSAVYPEFPRVIFWSHFLSRETSTVKNIWLPQTITTWDSEVVCLSPEHGLSIANPAIVRSFQLVFADFTMPTSVRRHERVHLAVSVFNYLNNSAPIKLSLNASDKFQIRGPSAVLICLPPGGKSIADFQVVAAGIGFGVVGVRVERSDVVPDCGVVLPEFETSLVEKFSVVEFEGETVQEVQSGLICGNSFSQPNHTEWYVKMSSPEYIPGSLSCIVRVTGDLLGSAIEGVENLIRKPTGCGEQTAFTLAINRMLVKYLLGSADQNFDVQKAINKSSSGLPQLLQQIFTFRHPDGSFSAFGPESGSPGSIWLTAFLLPHLTDKNVSQKWILSQQLENGCFPRIGDVYHWPAKRADSPIALTSFIVVSLLKAGVSADELVIKNAMVCVKAPNQEKDLYTEILSAYAIALAGDLREASSSFRDILSSAERSYDTLWWQDSETSSLESSIEMTSYAVLTMVRLNFLAPAANAVRWIVQQQNQNGGFISTQDTLAALTALSTFSASLPKISDRLNVAFKFLDKTRTVEISNSNRELRSWKISPFTTEIKFEATGTGCALVQTVLKYNVRKVKAERTLKIELKVEEPLVRVCVRTGLKVPPTHMAILEVVFPTGYFPDRSSLYRVTDSENGVEKFEEFSDRVNFYFDKLTHHKNCVSFQIQRENCVENAAPLTARIYDYYNSQFSALARHKIHQSCDDFLNQRIPNRRRRNAQLFSGFKEVSFDLEAPKQISNGFKLYAMPPTAGKGFEKCPRCLNESPQIFPKLYCSSQLAAQIRFRGKNLLSLMKNVSPQMNVTKIQRSVAFSVAENCTCSLISPGTKVLMLVTPPRKFNLMSIQIFHIDENITLIPWKSVARFIETISSDPEACTDILTSD